jgi:hypothetical protein
MQHVDRASGGETGVLDWRVGWQSWRWCCDDGRGSWACMNQPNSDAGPVSCGLPNARPSFTQVQIGAPGCGNLACRPPEKVEGFQAIAP